MIAMRSTPPIRQILATSASILVLVPTATVAQSECSTAPGVGAVDQYCEAVPSGDGNRATTSGQPTPSYPSVDQRVASQLAKTPEGRALLRSTGTDASTSTNTNTRTSRENLGSKGERPDYSGSTTPAGSDPSVPSNSPLRAVKSSVSTGSTAGPEIAWAAIGIAAVGCVAVLRRRHEPVQKDDESRD